MIVQKLTRNVRKAASHLVEGFLIYTIRIFDVQETLTQNYPCLSRNMFLHFLRSFVSLNQGVPPCLNLRREGHSLRNLSLIDA